MRSWFGKVLCVVTLAFCAGAAMADDALHVAGRLKRDVAAGALSGDDAALYAALAIVEPRSLPEQYALSTGDNCGMELLGILYETLQNAGPDVRDAVRYVMSPHERSRMERPRKLPGAVDVLADQWLSETTAHFRIHYTTTGPDATLQQNARELLQYLEDAYATYQALGFQMPFAPVDGRIDVVLQQNVCALLVLACGNGGMAIPPDLARLYGGESGNPLILLQSSITGDYRKVLAAHELFHHVQYQTAGFPNIFAAMFALEGQATAMEDVVHPELTHYDRHVENYYASLQTLMTARRYDAVIFWKYLIARYTLSFIKDYLGALTTANDIAALASTVAVYRTTADDVMRDFALWSFFVGSRYRAGYFDADARNWNLTSFAGDHVLGGDTRAVSAGDFVLGLATSYVRVTPRQNVGSNQTLKIKVRGAAPVRGWLVHRKSNGAADITDLNLQSGPAELEIDDFSFAGTTEVVLIFSNGTGFPGSFSYELELPLVLDLAFSMDTTGSMAGSIEAVKATASRTRELLESADADFRIAITEFKDHPVWPYGSEGDFSYRMNSVFSNEASVIDRGISMLYAWGGGDWPESAYSGIMGAINAVGITPWRKGVKKAVIVMTDAPPHDPEPYTSHTRAAVVAAANAGGAVERANSVARLAAHAVAAETPIAIYGVVVGSDFGAYSAMSALAGATGGKVWVTSYDSGNIAQAILEAIGEISGGEPPPPPSGNRPPDVSAAIADPGQLWAPNNKLVPIRITNVSDPDGDAVTIKVTRITQDEPRGRDADADGIGAATARVRATRNGGGNGRVYAIAFTATDARGASSSGSVTVCVPHDRGGNTVCTDDGQSYTSTAP